MKTPDKGIKAIADKLDQGEVVESSILCDFYERGNREEPFHGILAATQKRMVFFTSMLDEPNNMDIPYENAYSFVMDKKSADSEIIKIQHEEGTSVFQYKPGLEQLDHFLRLLEVKLKQEF